MRRGTTQKRGVSRSGRIAVSMLAVLACLGLPVAAVESRLAASADEAFLWKAGVARTVITPQKPVWLAGYGSKRVPDGKLHDLWAKALTLEDRQGRRSVLITSDFQGVPRTMSDRVFEQLRRKFGLERHQVMLTFSHNHCGPRLGDDLVDYYPVEAEQVELVAEYTTQMVDAVVALVRESISKLAPASLRIGEGKTTFAVNRRNNREAEVPALLSRGAPLAGPVDHAVPVMTITRPDRSLAAVLFGYACHPTTLSFTTWCGDYPGFAQLELEKNHPGATAMFVNTCGGDQNPLPRRSVDLCRKYGNMLATAVEAAMKQPLKPVASSFRSAFELIELPYLKAVTREDLTAAIGSSNAILARWAVRMLKKLEAGEKFSPSYPYPVHAWRLGNEVILIGLGAETVVDYALRFKREFGPGTWVCGYTDDMIAYIPSRRVWEEGGYEGGSNLYEYGRPAFRWAGDVEDRIVASVHKLVNQVREQRTYEAVEHVREVIFHSPQTPGYTCWTGAWVMPDGSTMISFTQATGPIQGRPKAPKDVMRWLDWYPEYDMTGLDLRNVHLRSPDGGKTWTKVSDDRFKSPMNGITGECETALVDGTILRGVWGYYLPYNPELPKTGYLERSLDGTKTWGKPEVFLDPGKYTAWPKRLRTLKDGRLLMLGGLARVPANSLSRQEYTKILEPLLMVSEDGGKSWSGPVEVLPREHRRNWGGEEFDAAELPDGSLLCVFRRVDPAQPSREVRWQGLLGRAGKTWVPRQVGVAPFPHSGHPELLATREGVILHLATTGIHWTEDSGKTWHKLDIPGTSYYPRSVQTADGTIQVYGHIGGDDAYGKVDQSIVMDRFRLIKREAADQEKSP